MARFLMISALEAAPWGAAEELWQQTALVLGRRGHDVAVSVKRWDPVPPGVAALGAAGLRVRPRGEASAGPAAPDELMEDRLVLINQPDVFSGLPWMTRCRAAGRRYAVLTHYGALHEWPDDRIVFDLRDGYRDAARCFFVAQATAELVERQTAQRLRHRQVVRAPYKVARTARPPWPPGDGLRLACVARLDLEDKGQDTLLHLLASARWRARPVSLSLYGEGPHARLLAAMIEHLRLGSVTLRGYAESVEAIWAEHHALVLPSRAEGLPAVIVEAMLCGRPCLVSDVAGNAELLRDGITGFIATSPSDRDVDEALDRLWQARPHLRAMGEAAAGAARRLVPDNPAELFADALEALAR